MNYTPGYYMNFPLTVTTGHPAPMPKPSRPLATPAAAERSRCLMILRELLAECNPEDSEEAFAIARLQRAISRIEG